MAFFSWKKKEEEWCRLALGVKKLGFSLAIFLNFLNGGKAY